MHIKQLYINNFRGFRNFKINTNKDLNIITGINNSGKTTILEAISLWNEIFNNLIIKAQKGQTLTSIRRGDFRFGKKNQNYIDYRQINSVRSFGYKDVFYNLNIKSTINITALIALPGNDEIEIGFMIKEANGNNYNVFLKDHDKFDFRKFNDSFINLPNSICCFFSSPVATVSSYEEFAITPKINEGIKARQSFLYFRNRIFNLQKGDEFDDFKNKLSEIIYNEPGKIEFKIQGDKSKDIYITVDVDINNTGFKDVSLLGSGTIQIIEILLHLFENRKDLNIILLDEPDSHIHRDIQKRLLQFLQVSEVQIILTTHNESLIRSASPKNIYFIDSSVSSQSVTLIESISNSDLPKRKMGISNSFHSKIINQLGSETTLDILNAFEADKIFFIEGISDSEYIKKIIDIYGSDKEYLFWSFDGINNLFSKIKYYKDFLVGLGSNVSIWDKCSIIIDSDFVTRDQRICLQRELSSKLHIPVFIWSSYTIESTILSDRSFLCQLIEKRCSTIRKTKEEIESSIELAFNSMRSSKLELFNTDESYMKSISGQLISRVKNLDEHLGIRRALVYKESDANLSSHYGFFSKGELNNKRIDHICNKDDVEKVLTDIYNTLGLSISNSSDNYFSELISYSDIQIQAVEWTNMMDFVNQ